MKLPFLRATLFASLAAIAGLSVRAGAQEPAEGTQAGKPDKAAVSPETVEARREALRLLVEAEAAMEAGHEARALQLGRDARRLYPESKAIAGFLAEIQKRPAPAAPIPPTHNRAKAHLAAALSRAQILMQQRRYAESLDLLNGVVEAAGKFPAGTDVSVYRDLAQKELIEYRLGVQAGSIRPNPETPVPAGAEPTEATTTPAPAATEFVAAPANAYRLARVAREQAPAWYTQTKAALRRTMSVDYRAMPLGLVLDDIHNVTGVNLIVDKPVQAAKTTLNALVDLRVTSVPAETVLSLATQVAGCEYVLMDKGVIVTTPDKAGDYVRALPGAVAENWARARYLFPDLYVDVMANRPLPEAAPGEKEGTEQPANVVPAYLRSGKDLVADIEQLIR